MISLDESTASEQVVYEHYKKIEAENYHLKRQLSHKHKEIRELKRSIRFWKEKAKKNHNPKPQYKNRRNFS